MVCVVLLFFSQASSQGGNASSCTNKVPVFVYSRVSPSGSGHDLPVVNTRWLLLWRLSCERFTPTPLSTL